MANYSFDGTTSSSVNFNPETDVLNIDGLSAGDIVVIFVGSMVIIRDPGTGNTIKLLGLKLNEITTSNILFEDGSILVVGDDSTSGNADKHGNDIDLSASTASNQVIGLGGNDSITMGDGNDVVKGNMGDDTIDGAGGDDKLKGSHGDDVLLGGSGDDILLGGHHKDFLDGGSGNDFLDGSQGDDTLLGGSGDDTLDGGHQKDFLDGGSGNDLLIGGFQRDTLEGGTGDDTLKGGQARDVLNGGDGNDSLNGGKQRDTLDGGDGDDTLKGCQGRDELYGGDGDDTLGGGWGSDILVGGTGNDVIKGGLGADSIMFNSTADGTDTITDFDHAEGDLLMMNGGVGSGEFQWGYQSSGTSKANTQGAITSDFFLAAASKAALLSNISNAANSLFGSSIGSGVTSMAYFFGFTSSSNNLYYIIANQHTDTGVVATTYSTITLANMSGINGIGSGADQIAQSDIILF